MTNEVSAGLGVRQPVSQIGGSSPFGVYKLAYTVDLSTLTAGTTHTDWSVKLLQSVNIGAMTKDLAAMVWTGSVNAKVTALANSGALKLAILVRDSTVKPNVTLDQLLNNIVNAPTHVVVFVTTPTVTTPGSTGNDVALSYNEYNSDATGNLQKDDYGNVIATGDTMIMDVAVTASPLVGLSPFTPSGTGYVTAWVTPMFS